MTTFWRRALVLAYFIVSDHFLSCLVSSQYAPEHSNEQVHHYYTGSQAHQYPDYYHNTPNQVYPLTNGIDRQGIQALLSSPGAEVIQFGALIILGGAAIITGVQAANTDRDLNTLRSRFTTVCNAVRVAGALDGGDVVEDPAAPVVDPAAQEALQRVNAVISALRQAGTTTCNF
ncbi:hypothetical protein TCAL_04701 [Tigriopus californicus]|uniref:Uncharacterized protein n=1 Tax=Tigriopus californicus TaxID=6832 RepID=A0A553NUS6_TIGCA|nr:uncharacterized protein LOC131883481 [Tigriopus californicus]TRY69189.1 hypothetical protein TCAL_04701 [Tigriopus californicus]